MVDATGHATEVVKVVQKKIPGKLSTPSGPLCVRRGLIRPKLRRPPDGFSPDSFLDARGRLALPIAKGLVSFVRKVDSHGRIEFNGAAYVIRRKLERQYVVATPSTHHRRAFIKQEGKLVDPLT